MTKLDEISRTAGADVSIDPDPTLRLTASPAQALIEEARRRQRRRHRWTAASLAVMLAAGVLIGVDHGRRGRPSDISGDAEPKDTGIADDRFDDNHQHDNNHNDDTDDHVISGFSRRDSGRRGRPGIRRDRVGTRSNRSPHRHQCQGLRRLSDPDDRADRDDLDLRGCRGQNRRPALDQLDECQCERHRHVGVQRLHPNLCRRWMHYVPNAQVTLSVPVVGVAGQVVWSMVQENPEPPGYATGPYQGGPQPLVTQPD